MKPKRVKNIKKKCRCAIRGIVDMWKINGKDKLHYRCSPSECAYWLRKFKYCPTCGTKIAAICQEKRGKK